MSVLLVTYDLNKEPNSKDYQSIIDIIKKHSWARLSESSYAIETSATPEQIYNNFKPHLDTNDYILVIRLKKPYFGYHKKDVIDWLDRNLAY